MKKLLVFLKGSSFSRVTFSKLSPLYPSIELSTFSSRTFQRVFPKLQEAISTTEEPLHIIALGDYSLNVNHIRIELICKNLFGKFVLGKKETYGLPSYYELLDSKLIPANCELKNTGMRNSYCNLLSYKICEYISELPKDLKEKIYFDFLHVPKKFHQETELLKTLISL